MDSNEPTEIKQPQVLSFKLIDGSCLISEAYLSDDQTKFVLQNPFVVEKVSQGNHTLYVLNEYDPFTDSSIIDLYFESLLASPNVVDDKFYNFYVKSILNSFITRLKEAFGDSDDCTKEQDITEIAVIINQFIETLETKFCIEIKSLSQGVPETPIDKSKLH